MHYIIGTRIALSEIKAPPQQRVVTINSVQRSLRRTDVGPFKLGVEYILSNISSSKEGPLQYHFQSSNGEHVTIPFTSTKDADRYIANVRGESIPDYDDFFRRSIG